MDFYKELGHFSSIKNDQNREGPPLLSLYGWGLLRVSSGVTWGLGPWAVHHGTKV